MNRLLGIPETERAGHSSLPSLRAVFIGLIALTSIMHLSSPCLADDTPVPDPFSDLAPLPSPDIPSLQSTLRRDEPWWSRDTQFRRELFLQTAVRDTSSVSNTSSSLYNRHSLGFEWLRRFQGATSTIATCDLQMRAVRRDSYMPVIQDMEGADRIPWAIEYHNAYCDIFNPVGYLLDEQQSAELVGKVNARIGRFYLPLGLNLATDTHGTILQLSNDQNIGFERDWYAGFWGSLSPSISYDAYYLAGSGYDLRFDGQSGMFGFRLSTGTAIKNELGLEGGLSTLIGERLAGDHQRLAGEAASKTDAGTIITTRRFGPDLRYTIPSEIGSFTTTNEASFGSDDGNDTAIHLHQIGYLTNSRRWGANLQLRQQWRKTPTITPPHHHHETPPPPSLNQSTSSAVSRSLFYDLSYYFSNDIANANLHWLNLSIEQILESERRGSGTIFSVQYYRYW